MLQISDPGSREATPLVQISRQRNGKLSRNTAEDPGSNPGPRTNFLKFPKITWNEHCGLPECPYLRRYIVDFGLFSLRLYRWQSSDDDHAYHDHPSWFITVVLWGGYTDISPKGRDTLRVGSIRLRPAQHRHTVQINKSGTWTLMVWGQPTRRWGFWVGDKLIRRDKYFAVYGHHPCDPGGEPVKFRPDGSRIS